MAGVGTVTVTILGNATHLKQTMADVDQTLGDKLGNIGAKMQSAGRKMTLGLTLPIVGGAALAVKAFGDFEQQLNTFKAVSSATVEQMAQVGQLAKDLGKDITLPGTSAKDAADAMTELAKAGLSVNDTMAASKAVLQLSAAAQIGNAEAATLTATALNAFRLKGKDAIRVADLLAATANASSAEIVDVGEAMSQASAVFSAAKIPVEDLSTAIGLLANNGIRGSDAGTSLKSALLALQTPSKQQAGIMKEVGFSLYDAQGNMKSMRDVIGNLEKSFKGMTQQQRDTNLGILFGSDAIRTGNILLAEGVVGWDELKAEVTKGGAAAEVAGAKMKGVKGSVEALKSNVETLAISVGEKLAPILADWAKNLSSLVDWFGSLSPKMQDTIMWVALVVAAIGPLVYIIGTIITVIKALNVVMLFLAANPVVAIIAAIALLVGAFILAYKHSQDFRDIVNAVIQAVANYFMDQIGFILDAIGLLIGGFATMVEAASHIPVIGEKFKGVGEALRGAQDSVQGWADTMHRGIDLVVGDAERAKRAFQTLESHVRSLNNAVGPTTDLGAALGIAGFRAVGGPVSAGKPYIVGEVGPELFVPSSSGTIIPAGTSSGSAAAGTTINYSIAVTAIDPAAAQEAVVSAIKEFERRNGTGWRAA